MGQTPAFYFVGAFYFLRCLTHQVNALSMLCTCDSSTRAFHVWFEGRSTLGPSLSKFIPHFFLAKSCETYSALEDLQQDAWVSPSDAP